MLHNITYEIVPQADKHRFRVTMRFRAQNGECVLWLPAWVQGSYMRRDLAGYASRFGVEQKGRHLSWSKKDLNSFSFRTQEGEVSVSYEIYAFDPSVRLAYLDDRRGFFNPSSLLMALEGAEKEPVRIKLSFERPQEGWKTASPLEKNEEGYYQARDIAEAYDSPFEMGTFKEIFFEACGRRHHIVFSGEISGLNPKQLADIAYDAKQIASTEIAFFSPEEHKAPFGSYLTIVFLGKNLFGGLEHRSSSVLTYDGGGIVTGSGTYEDFLELFAHEYFHAWWVKTVRPACYAGLSVKKVIPTRLLWVFEGFTSYYEIKMLFKAGIISREKFFDKLSSLLTDEMRSSARLYESLENSSLEAWIKYYRPDGNRPNSVVNYYGYGALIGFALDAAIREKTGDVFSLDDVLRKAYKDALSPDYGGVPENGMEEIIRLAVHADMSQEIDAWVRKCVLPDFQKLGSFFHVSLQKEPAEASLAEFGIRAAFPGGRLVVKSVFDGSYAQDLGLAEGDEILSVNGERFSQTEHGGPEMGSTAQLRNAADQFIAGFTGQALAVDIRRFGEKRSLTGSRIFEPAGTTYRFVLQERAS